MSVALAFVTANKPCSAQRLVRSARRHLGSIAIYVADQSVSVDAMSAFYEASAVHALKLSSETGLGAARNALLREIREDFILLCDDDLVLGPCSTVDDAVTVLENVSDIGAVGGRLHELDDAGERVRIDEKYFQLDAWHRSFTTIPIAHYSPVTRSVAGIDVYVCDSVTNFCIFRRSVFSEGNQWDERIRSRGDHEDFFLNLKRNTQWRVVQLPSMAALKVRSHPERGDDWTDFLEKWDVGQFLQVGPAADEIEKVTEAGYDDSPTPQVQEVADSAEETFGLTSGQTHASSPVFQLRSLVARCTWHTAARGMSHPSLRSLLESAVDLPLYDASAAMMRCCYSPVRSGADLIVWCRPQSRARSRKGKRSWFAAADRNHQKLVLATLCFRWFDDSGQPLVWESERVDVELHDAYWSPVVARIPLWPDGIPYVRFEVIAERGDDRIPVAVGFLFAESSVETCAPSRKALALSLPRPKAVGDPDAGGTLTALASDPQTPSRSLHFSPTESVSMLKIDLTQSALVDVRALLFLDWAGTGRRLTALDTSQAGFQLTSCVVIPKPPAERASALGLLNSGKYCRLALAR